MVGARLYANGQEKWYRCDTKSQAKALYGRLKGEQRKRPTSRKNLPSPKTSRSARGFLVALKDQRTVGQSTNAAMRDDGFTC